MKHEVRYVGSTPGFDHWEVVPEGKNDREIIINGTRGVFTCTCGHLVYVGYVDGNSNVFCGDCKKQWYVSGMLYTAREVAL